MSDETKVRLTDDLALPPGSVITPGYAVPEPNPNANGFSDRVIVVHEDNAARALRLSEFHTATPADHPILSTAENAGRSEQSEADGVRAAREHAAEQRKAAGK